MGEKKLRVLIVDDEKRIAMMIGKIIHWDEMPIELAGIYDDSEVALKMIDEVHPDIVISDIKMPVLDGTQLIKKSLEMGNTPHFILISGYRDFEYAHTALQFGVEDYLLKPINEQELNNVIKKICDKKFEQRLTEQHYLETKRQNQEFKNREAMEELEKESGISEIPLFNDEYQQNLSDGIMCAYVIKIDSDSEEKGCSAQQRRIMNCIVEMFQTGMSGIYKEEIHAVKSNMTLNIILNYAPENRAQVERAFTKTFSLMQEYLYDFEGYELTIGIGEETDFLHIRDSLRVAKRHLAARIILGTGRIIKENSYEVRDFTDAKYIAGLFTNELLNARDSLSEIKIRIVIGSWINYLRKKDGLAADVYYDSAKIMVKCFFGIWENTKNHEQETILSTIDQCYSIFTLKEVMKKELQNATSLLRKEKLEENERPIRIAIDYIEINFDKKISIEEVAEIVHLNDTYFAMLFKKETGKTFLVYLTEYRMEKAKKYLKETDDIIATIAENVGYSDSRYFSKTFEKNVGMKPSFYRRMYS